MDNILQEAIEKTINDPYIKWNNEKLKFKISGEYIDYIENRPMLNQGNRLCCGYYPLLHNIASSLGEYSLIVELGNREGLSTLAIFDALKDNHQFITFDIVHDLRFIPDEVWNDERFCFIQCDVNQEEIVKHKISENTNRTIDLLFCDTIHTYKQINKEFNVIKKYLSDQAIILVDDIHLSDKFRFYQEWQGKKYDITDSMHYPSGFAAFIYEVQK